MESTVGSIKKHTVGIGFVAAEKGSAELTAYAIGSCIALCLYEPTARVGAMAHIMLPSASFSGHKNNAIDISTKYADHALCAAIDKITALGGAAEKIRAAIVGGAQMFPHGEREILNIGEMNIASVTEELQKRNIPLVYSDLGGQQSRTVVFSIPGNDFSTQITIKSRGHLQ